MIYNSILETVELDLDTVYLDPNNPRFSEDYAYIVPDERIVEGSVQDRAYDTMLRQHDIESLAQTIEKVGFLRIHRIVVRKLESHPDAFVVVEGNRRISACRYLQSQHLDGKEFGQDILDSFLKLEGLVYQGEDQSISWEIQGINHLTGIKPWSPYNQAHHLVRKMEDDGMTLGNVARSFAMTPTKAGRMVRAYYALRQLKGDEEFSSRAKNSHYSYFEEAFGKPDVRNWLEWDDNQRGFTNSNELKKFYRWFLPEDDADKKLPMAIDVRKLPPIIQEPQLLQRFDSELSLEDALREAGRNEPPRDIQETKRALEQAKNVINSITAGILREHGPAIRTELQNLIDIASDVKSRCEE